MYAALAGAPFARLLKGSGASFDVGLEGFGSGQGLSRGLATDTIVVVCTAAPRDLSLCGFVVSLDCTGTKHVNDGGQQTSDSTAAVSAHTTELRKLVVSCQEAWITVL